MALPAVFLDAECLLAVMACAALFPCVHLRHLKLGLFHREDLGMAVIALETFVRMHLAIKNDFAHSAVLEFDGLARRHCERTAHKCQCDEYCQYQCYYPHLFTPFLKWNH